MTVSSLTTSVTYVGNGVTTAFPVTFPFFEITVEETIAGTTTALVEGSDYSISGGAGSTGTVTISPAPASGTQIRIRRTTDRRQLADYVENDPFPAQTHEQALDRLTMVVQEIANRLDSDEDGDQGTAITAPESEEPDFELPSAADRANGIIVFDADGNVTVEPLTQSALQEFLQDGTDAVPRTVQSKLRDRVSVLDFIPSALHAGIKAGTNTTDLHGYITAAIAAAYAIHAPTGTYLTSEDIALPDDRHFFGDGPGRTIIKMTDDADVLADVIANENRVLKKYFVGDPGSTYDVYNENIHISSMTLECRGRERTAGMSLPEYDTYGGCGVKLAGVRHFTVTDVTVRDPIMHGIAMDPFALANNFSIGHSNYDIAGPCMHGEIIRPRIYNHIVDDGVTTHAAKHIKVVDPRCFIEDAYIDEAYESQNAVEFDGASEYCTVIGGYSDGFPKGVAVVGHYHEPPARHILVDGFTAERAYITFTCWNNPGGGDTGSPNYIAPGDRAAQSQARSVIFRNITAKNLRNIADRQDANKWLQALWFPGYSDVLVDGLTIDGIHEDSQADCYLSSRIEGYNIRIKNVRLRNIKTSVTNGRIFWIPNTNSQSGIEFDGIDCGTLDGSHTYIIADDAGGLTRAANIEVAAQTGLTASVISVNPNAIYENINVPGAVAKIHNGTGIIDYDMPTVLNSHHMASLSTIEWGNNDLALVHSSGKLTLTSPTATQGIVETFVHGANADARVSFVGTGTTSATHVACGAVNDDFVIRAGNNNEIQVTSTAICPWADGGSSLGTSAKKFNGVHISAGIQYNGVQVLAARETGFTTAVGSANKNASGINVGTITASDANIRAVAAWVKALHDALATHGIIGT
jgi:hypothetical protein